MPLWSSGLVTQKSGSSLNRQLFCLDRFDCDRKACSAYRATLRLFDKFHHESKGVHHSVLQEEIDLTLRPSTAVGVLEPLTVRHDDASRVAQDVGKDVRTTLEENAFRFCARRTVCRFEDCLTAHVARDFGRDLHQCCWNDRTCVVKNSCVVTLRPNGYVGFLCCFMCRMSSSRNTRVVGN